jgi:hypothetical protein
MRAHHRLRAALAVAALAVGVGFTAAPAVEARLDAHSFRDPAAAFRPSFYWWWPGGAVEGSELRREIAEMDAAGFGSATMTWLALGMPDAEDPSVATWGTPAWRARVADALRAARDGGVRLDFTSATAWPFNSPATTPENGLSSQELVYASRKVQGSTELELEPPRPDDADDATLVAVTAARATGAPGGPKPRMLAADSVLDLTAKIGEDGRLRWSVPAGRWIVFGLWHRPTGQQPAFGEAAVEPTYAINHFDRRSVDAATSYFDAHVLADPVTPLLSASAGAVYLDSLEIDAEGLLWTRDFLSDFERRRGYSLVPYLPALFIAGQHQYFEPGTANDPPDFDLTGGMGARARHDYYETLTDLYISNQLEPMAAWARSRGLSLRAQPGYGTTLDPIRSAAAVPALETETLAHRQPAAIGSPASRYGLDAYRMTASGAHIGKANEVGLELGAEFNRDYALTLADVKSMIDHAYAGGVNQAVLHGYPYRTAPGSDWPSWHPFSSEWVTFGGFSETWSGVQPQWRHMRGLADYIARNNLALQHGEARVDLAVYRDGLLVADVATPDPGPVFEGSALEAAGFTYGFVDPVSLAQRRDVIGSRSLFPDGPGFRALVIDGEDAMPADAAQRILAFARRGLPVVVIGERPQRGTSLRDTAGEDREVRTAFDALLRERSVRQVASTADVRGALRALGVEPRLRFAAPSPIHSAQREGDGTSVFYLWNPGPSPASVDASFEAHGRPAILDAWSGDVRPVRTHQRRESRTELPLQLGAGETMLVRFGGPRGGDATAARTVALPTMSMERWRLEVDGSTPQGAEIHELELDRLRDWREIPEIRDSAGNGRYRTTVRLGGDGRRAAGVLLDLGTVHGSVQVRVDGVRISDRVVAGAPFDIPGRLVRDGRAKLEIEVATPLRNRLLALARAGHPGYARFRSREAAGSGSQPAGLVGPVTVTPYVKARVRRP